MQVIFNQGMKCCDEMRNFMWTNTYIFAVAMQNVMGKGEGFWYYAMYTCISGVGAGGSGGQRAPKKVSICRKSGQNSRKIWAQMLWHPCFICVINEIDWLKTSEFDFFSKKGLHVFCENSWEKICRAAQKFFRQAWGNSAPGKNPSHPQIFACSYTPMTCTINDRHAIGTKQFFKCSRALRKSAIELVCCPVGRFHLPLSSGVLRGERTGRRPRASKEWNYKNSNTGTRLPCLFCFTCGFHRACLTLLNDFPGALSFCDVCVLVRVLFWDSQCRVVQFLCRFVLLLIKEALSSLRAGSSELVSQAGLFVARLSQYSYGTAD